MIRAMFFDLDGTLLDTRRANFAAYRVALSSVGEEFTPEQFKESWGKDARDFLPDLYPELSLNQVGEVCELKAKIYGEFFEETTINLGLLDVIRTSKAAGIRTGLVTTAKKRSLKPLLEFHRILEIFDVIVSGDDVSQGKPDPEPYLKALSLTGCQSSNAVAFEDSEAGILSAERAGINTIRIMFGN